MLIANYDREKKNNIFNNKMFEVVQALGFSISDLAEIAEISESEMRDYSNKFANMPSDPFFKIAKELNLSAHSLYDASFDVDTLSEHRSGNTKKLKNKYDLNASSRMKTFHNLIEYLSIMAPNSAVNLMKQLQVTREALDDDNRPVNIQLIDDGYKILAENGFGSEDFKRIGQYGAEKYKVSDDYFSSVNKMSEPAKIFADIFHDRISMIDKNCKYKIGKWSRKELYLHIYPTEESVELYKTKKIYSLHFCDHKVGFAKGIFSHVVDGESSRVVQTKCVHWGDKHCTLKVVF